MRPIERKKRVTEEEKQGAPRRAEPRLALVVSEPDAPAVSCLLEQILRRCGNTVRSLGFFDNRRYGKEKKLRLRQGAASRCQYVLAGCSDPIRFLKNAEGLNCELLLYAAPPAPNQAPAELCARFHSVVLDYGYSRADLPEGPLKTYSIGDDRADYTARNLRAARGRTWFELLGLGVIGRVGVALRYRPEEALPAIAAALSLGLAFDDVLRAVGEIFDALASLKILLTQNRTCIYASSYGSVRELEQSLALVRAGSTGKLALACCARQGKDNVLHMAERYADAVLLTGNSCRHSELTERNAEIYLELQKKGIPCLFLKNDEDALKCAVTNAVTYDIIFLVEENAPSGVRKDGGRGYAGTRLQLARGAAVKAAGGA